MAFAKNFQPESDQASRSNYKITGIAEDRGTRSTMSGNAVGKIQTVGNSSGQMNQFLTQKKKLQGKVKEMDRNL